MHCDRSTWRTPKTSARASAPSKIGTGPKSGNGNGTTNGKTGNGKHLSEGEAIVSALEALQRGDFGHRLRPRDGASREVQDAFNVLAERLELTTLELTRVTRVVGRDGEMGERLRMDGLRGGWEAMGDSFNTVISDLVRPSTEVARVIVQVAEGDLSQKMALEIDGKPIRGEFLRIGINVNRMVDQLRAFASEVTRVAREVGTEGKLGGQANVPGVAGTWKDLTDNVNSMASNLTTQVRGIAGVVTAVATGDLSKKLVLETQGEILELKNTVNTMVDQLSSFAREVTRVAKEVGTEGKLGGQATVRGVSGTWKDLTDSVNGLAGNLTVQLRDVSKVATAIASRRPRAEDQRRGLGARCSRSRTSSTAWSTRCRRSRPRSPASRARVGSEGKLGGQANVPAVGGTWRDLTDSVNNMASNLTGQVRNIAQVTTAVANGDLTQKITVDVKGEMLEMKNTLNTMVDQLRSFAAEVTRVAREVGSEGKLGGQSFVPGVGGTWKDLTDGVNGMASNLTSQVRNIALVTTAVANGDLSQKITVDVKGEMLEMKNTLNTMVDQLRSFASEVTRVAREVGTEGKLGGQAFVPGVAGTWKDLTDNVNYMASNLTTQVRGIAKVVTAVAKGDLSKRLVVEAKGEIAELAETINDMTQTLGIFADQVTTVAREVGSEGKLGGQARVPGVAGTWKDLTDSVNGMASNLTTQVRGIIKLVTAVAQGDLSQKFTMDAQGEIAALADTLNTMTETLRAFGSEVTRVAREVGTEGKLGGQAKVPGAQGTWRDLTDNTNQLAANLTNQIRAMAEVATAITEGDLTRSITVEAEGEVAQLKERVNQMIANLRDTTQKNTEQDWLKTNLARFGGLMQGQKSLESVSRLIMSELTPLVAASHGAFFVMDESEGGKQLKLLASYAYKERKHVANRFRLGEGIVGQAALEKKSDRALARAERLRPDQLGPRRVTATEPDRHSDLVRGRRPRGRRARELRELQRDSPHLPRAALGVDRRRPQHDRREHAHRGAPQAVAVSRPRAPGAVARAAAAAGAAEALEQRARTAGEDAPGVRRDAPRAARGAAASERGARREGVAARRAEPRRRAEEQRGRARAASGRREGLAARALVEVQERVPREHEPRAPHAAELAPHPRADALGQQRLEPQSKAGRVREDDPRRGIGSPQLDQRGARPVEGRGRQDRDLPDRRRAHGDHEADRVDVQADGDAEEARVQRRRRPRRPRDVEDGRSARHADPP